MMRYQVKVAKDRKVVGESDLNELVKELRSLDRKGSQTASNIWAESISSTVNGEIQNPQGIMKAITEKGYSIVSQKISDITGYRNN